MSQLAIVTATANPIASQECRSSWTTRAGNGHLPVYTVVNGHNDEDIPEGWYTAALGMECYGSREFLGVVPAFAIGVQQALEDGHDVIACFHDDLLIEQQAWDLEVLRIFKTCPKAGLVGFGGAQGLAAHDIYQKPYDPMQLARRGFISNMRDAEAHGSRVDYAQPIAVLDGFSQIGTANFWKGYYRKLDEYVKPHPIVDKANLFAQMASWGIVHHAYDAALGALAKQLGYQVWLAPIACHHYGGRTAVGSAEYQAWAQQQVAHGDQGFWQEAHRIVYDKFRGILPIN